VLTHGGGGSIDVTSLTDNVHGDVTQATGTISSTDCSVPQTLSTGTPTYTCSFTATVAAPPETDTVTANGLGPGAVQAQASASVALMPNVPAFGPASPFGPSWGLLALFGLLLSVGGWLASRSREVDNQR